MSIWSQLARAAGQSLLFRMVHWPSGRTPQSPPRACRLWQGWKRGNCDGCSCCAGQLTSCTLGGSMSLDVGRVTKSDSRQNRMPSGVVGGGIRTRHPCDHEQQHGWGTYVRYQWSVATIHATSHLCRLVGRAHFMGVRLPILWVFRK